MEVSDIDLNSTSISSKESQFDNHSVNNPPCNDQNAAISQSMSVDPLEQNRGGGSLAGLNFSETISTDSTNSEIFNINSLIEELKPKCNIHTKAVLETIKQKIAQNNTEHNNFEALKTYLGYQSGVDASVQLKHTHRSLKEWLLSLFNKEGYLKSKAFHDQIDDLAGKLSKLINASNEEPEVNMNDQPVVLKDESVGSWKSTSSNSSSRTTSSVSSEISDDDFSDTTGFRNNSQASNNDEDDNSVDSQVTHEISE